ncbi:hypothetical protein [Paraburkholderia sp. J12]|uniref:hypothetical protein n=1 Tax=Paraburkholderia sp. J12 TaxID=2805432 RepID=UPI002ABE489B|nr:hypothetical protein [Paraburkholderia sp. J12]
MKHAGSEALKRLESLLCQLREFPGLSERSTGIFYRKSKPFLHFHEDPTGLYADVRIELEFERFPVNSEGEKSTLLKAIGRAIAPA